MNSDVDRHALELLTLHRERLVFLLERFGHLGTRATPQDVEAILDARTKIAEYKSALREFGVVVEDEPIDEPDQSGKLYAVVMLSKALPPETVLDLVPLPPEFATYLLWYLPKKDREAVMGDLEEEFWIVYKRFGRRKAVIRYYYQVGASFWPYVVQAGKKLIKWGVMGWVGDLFRRIIS
jgi:hypothetical protein